jgi:hypothetical protein
MLNRAEILKQQFNQSIGLPWQQILPQSRIEEISVEENIEYWVMLQICGTAD